MKPSPRRLYGLLGILALAIGAAAWTAYFERHPDEAVEAVERTPVSSDLSSTDLAPPKQHQDTQVDAPSLDLDRLRHRELIGTEVDTFRVKSWYVPPPPPPPEPPPKPTAPPLPFQYMGRTEEVQSGATLIYLTNGGEFYTIKVGDRFADSYQLERIERGALHIRYLPLSIHQTLPIAPSE